MSNTNPRATTRHPHPKSDNPRPPDPCSIKQAHIHKVANENGSETTIWHYRVSKQHKINQPRMSPHDMLIELARTLYQSDNQFSIIHQKTTTTTTVGWREIKADPDMSKYTSSCTTAKGATSTTLLVSITNNYTNLQQLERPIDDLAVSFAGRWHVCPDRFCGLKSCMVGVFTNAPPPMESTSRNPRRYLRKRSTTRQLFREHFK